MGLSTILVTGGAGYIGSHTCKLLAAKGYIPVTIDNLSTGHEDNVRWGPLHIADIRDTGQLAKVMHENEIEGVLHFAASAYVGESVTNPLKYYDNNLNGMSSLLVACRQAGVSRIVFSSSCATYGIPPSLPIRESTPQAPINPYGFSKLVCERMIKDCDRAYGLQHAILRYFNASGADPEGELRERHDPETHLIPLALRAASGVGEPLTIMGDDYETEDGTCVRDYIHVQDLAIAHWLALEKLQVSKSNIEVNLGTGEGYSILHIIREIERISGKQVPFKMGARRSGDPPILISDPEKAMTELHFRASHSDLTNIVATAARSFGFELT